ncbi:hypothetical protein [Rhodococcus sp. ARC_M6]|uniref:hypothetical protein n=1 Tax=Rhodococcus sp. ARC_M6 TaxID=2928852 RepID=UPI001FB50C1F|nr:hypothetical protein [Rhodococcus sp. ARC_M6]MCJ0906701.1 hypothetical protein [Rhodococcus sp. ARC_M6]
MILVTWRQCRTHIVWALSIVVLVIAASAIAGIYVHRSGTFWEFGRICSRWYDVGICRPATTLSVTTLLALLLPVLFGMFVGVTIFSRDLEHGAHVLGLPQSVSRMRWYFSRVLVVFVPITLAMTVLGLVLSWTQNSRKRLTKPEDRDSFSMFDFPIFETTGIAIGGYTFLALITGSAAALILRNTVGAMVATLVMFLIAPVILTALLRPHYTEPDTKVQSINGYTRATEYAPSPYYTVDASWVVGAGFTDRDGNMITADYSQCVRKDSAKVRAGETTHKDRARTQIEYAERTLEFDNCLRLQRIDHYEILSHPQSRYWQFQTIETALILLCAELMSLLANIRRPQIPALRTRASVAEGDTTLMARNSPA